jgi:hypothetical protein
VFKSQMQSKNGKNLYLQHPVLRMSCDVKLFLFLKRPDNQIKTLQHIRAMRLEHFCLLQIRQLQTKKLNVNCRRLYWRCENAINTITLEHKTLANTVVETK